MWNDSEGHLRVIAFHYVLIPDGPVLRSLPKRPFASAGRFFGRFHGDASLNEDARRNVYGSDSRRAVDKTWLVVRPTMELLNPIKAFLAVTLIHVGSSIDDGNGDLSTVSESFGVLKIQTDWLRSRDWTLNRLRFCRLWQYDVYYL